MNADIERLIALLKEPRWQFDRLELFTRTFQAPSDARLSIESVQRRAARLEIQFFAPEVPGRRPLLAVEAPSGVWPTVDPALWQIDAARQVTWDGEEVPPSAAVKAPAILIGRRRVR